MVWLSFSIRQSCKTFESLTDAQLLKIKCYNKVQTLIGGKTRRHMRILTLTLPSCN